MRAGEHRAGIVTEQFLTKRLWRVAALTAAGVIGVTSHVEAAIYWSDPTAPAVLLPGAPSPPPRRHKPRRQVEKKPTLEKDTVKPQGPVIVSISIAQQKLRIYDANGFFAETPVSTGMPGHPTPMGVFSVIEKDRLHHSNIYSGAPMPYMQRITWSGVAMHAGVLPGHPASHGCIRMPMAFAMKMWNWTKMGARVVVSPNPITPVSFSHPLLAEMKVVPPPPVAADEPKPDAPAAAKIDKAADADIKPNPAILEASAQLRSTVGHNDGPTEPPASVAQREQTRTADASSALPATNPSATMSDAAPAGSSTPSASEPAVSEKVSNALITEAKPDAATPEAQPAAAQPDEVASSEARPPQATPAEVKSAEVAPAESVPTGTASSEAGPVAAAKPETAPLESPQAEAPKAEGKAEGIRAEAPKPDVPKPAESPAVSSIPAVAPVAIPPVKKDQGRATGNEKSALAKPEPPKRSGQIAAFISRKDSKLYVRQNFAPLFETPVTIAPSDRPLGTHVFTAQVDKEDPNVLHWSVVSLPPSKRAERRDEDERASRRRKVAGSAQIEAAPAPVPDSPAEALDRLNLPPDAMTKITEAISTGGSIIISDQGIAAGETGKGTDFIVSLR
jgi:lipoprotein-anchoring transpeptidase ErfK/SrfK